MYFFYVFLMSKLVVYLYYMDEKLIFEIYFKSVYLVELFCYVQSSITIELAVD